MLTVGRMRLAFTPPVAEFFELLPLDEPLVVEEEADWPFLDELPPELASAALLTALDEL